MGDGWLNWWEQTYYLVYDSYESDLNHALIIMDYDRFWLSSRVWPDHYTLLAKGTYITLRDVRDAHRSMLETI